MRKPQSVQEKRTSMKQPILIGLGIALVILIVATYMLLKGLGQNYAEETSRPLKSALVNGGAVEKCSSGDAGKGPDNKAPNYTVIFETSLDRSKASDLVNQVASNNGYKLSIASSSYPEIVTYYDHTAKQSSYSALKSGPILLGVSLYDGGSHLGCANTKITYNKTHTAIKIDVSLPEYK